MLTLSFACLHKPSRVTFVSLTAERKEVNGLRNLFNALLPGVALVSFTKRIEMSLIVFSDFLRLLSLPLPKSRLPRENAYITCPVVLVEPCLLDEALGGTVSFKLDLTTT